MNTLDIVSLILAGIGTVTGVAALVRESLLRRAIRKASVGRAEFRALLEQLADRLHNIDREHQLAGFGRGDMELRTLFRRIEEWVPAGDLDKVLAGHLKIVTAGVNSAIATATDITLKPALDEETGQLKYSADDERRIAAVHRAIRQAEKGARDAIKRMSDF